MTELEQRYAEKVRELERIHASDAADEDLRMRRKELGAGGGDALGACGW